MDLLTGYGSGSDSDDDVAPPPVAAAPEVKPRGLQGSLPKPTGAAAGTPANFLSGYLAICESTVAAGTNHVASGNGKPAARPAAAALPADFFDAGGAPSPSNMAAAAAAAAAAVDKAEEDGPSAPSHHVAAGTAGLAQPSDQQLWNKLPAPRTATGKRKVLFRPQINLELLAASDSDDEDSAAARAAKKARQAAAAAGAGGKPSILSFLPAPKHVGLQRGGIALWGTRLDTGGGGGGGAKAASSSEKGGVPYQPDDKHAGSGAAAPVALGNEAYRLNRAPAPAPAGAAGGLQQPEQYQQHQYYDTGAGFSSGGQQQYMHAAAAGSAAQQYLPPEEALLQEALQAEASKAARRAAGTGSSQLLMPNIQFKEVNADQIKHVDPAQREAAQGARAALGADYAAQLRGQAAPHVGSRLARSKHQIGTLFANAKLQELEMLEKRASGMKSKAETAGKYGW